MCILCLTDFQCIRFADHRDATISTCDRNADIAELYDSLVGDNCGEIEELDDADSDANK